MANPNKMKIYGGVLGIAFAFLVIDQLVPAGTTDASQKENPYAAKTSQTAVIPVMLHNPKIISLDNRFVGKLKSKAAEFVINQKQIDNAFVIPKAWGLLKPPEETTKVNPQVKPEVDIVAQFVAKYQLTGILSQQGEGIAVINGNKFLVVGKKLAGFQLVAVTDRKAVFLQGKLIAELKLKTVNANQ